MKYKILFTTDKKNVGKEVVFNGDDLIISKDNFFTWQEAKKSGERLILKNSNYIIILNNNE